MRTKMRKVLLGLAVIVVVAGVGLVSATPAQAQWGAVYHGSSIHYGRIPQTTLYWTPGSGLQLRTGYNYVPYYRPVYVHGYHGGHHHGHHTYHRRHH